MADQPLRPDIAAAAKRMDTQMGAKREIRSLAQQLWTGEKVDHMVAGTYAGGTGLVVLTDRRLLFYKDGWTSKTTEDFPIGKISSLQWSEGPLLGKMTVFASGNKAEITNVGKVCGKVIADTIRNRQAPEPAAAPAPAPPAPAPVPPAPAPAPAPAPVAPPAPATPPAQAAPVMTQQEVFDALRQLGELRDAGIVTPEEFDAKKKQLLDRI